MVEIGKWCSLNPANAKAISATANQEASAASSWPRPEVPHKPSRRPPTRRPWRLPTDGRKRAKRCLNKPIQGNHDTRLKATVAQRSFQEVSGPLFHCLMKQVKQMVKQVKRLMNQAEA